MVCEGKHEPIISVEMFESAQAKQRARAGRSEPIDKDHHYIYSALVKCPICGKSLYGVPTRGKKRKDGTIYPTYYSYACRSSIHMNGIKCGYGQISCTKVDKAMYGIITGIVNAENFGETMSKLIGEKIDTSEIQRELDTATKDQR